jgi:hypothetical protein
VDILRLWKRGFNPKGYLIDENTRLKSEDLEQLKHMRIMNSTDKFKKGTKDELLIEWVKMTGWVLVTKDIRMAIRGLMEACPVLLVNEDFGIIALMETRVHDVQIYKDLHKYLSERYGIIRQENSSRRRIRKTKGNPKRKY